MTHASPDEDGAQAAPGFAAILRDHTKLVHREAERAGFIADLIRARATRDSYATFLRNLVPVYAALESALGASDPDAPIAAFADPRLRRSSALAADLEAIQGGDWASALPLLPEAETYAAAIAATVSDERLIAHAYARYLGDLSGGQILKPVLARTLALGPEALTFYDFPEIIDLDVPKRAMRTALDRVSPTGPVAESILAEAITAFRHNIALSDAVHAASA